MFEFGRAGRVGIVHGYGKKTLCCHPTKGVCFRCYGVHYFMSREQSPS